MNIRQIIEKVKNEQTGEILFGYFDNTEFVAIKRGSKTLYKECFSRNELYKGLNDAINGELKSFYKLYEDEPKTIKGKIIPKGEDKFVVMSINGKKKVVSKNELNDVIDKIMEDDF